MPNLREASAERGAGTRDVRLRVLVVADSEEISLTLRRILRGLGHLPIAGNVVGQRPEDLASVFDRAWDVAIIRVAGKLLSEPAWARFFSSLSRGRERMVVAGDRRACTIVISRRAPEERYQLLLALALSLGTVHGQVPCSRSKRGCRNGRLPTARSNVPPFLVGA